MNARPIREANDGIQQAITAIRQTWSHAERDRRRRMSKSRQQWLFSLLSWQQALPAARIA